MILTLRVLFYKTGSLKFLLITWHTDKSLFEFKLWVCVSWFWK